MKKNFETLEFNVIKDKLKAFASSSLTIDKINYLQPITDLDELNLSLLKSEEAMKCINHYGRLPLGGFNDISIILKKADMDGILTGEELNTIYNHLECLIHLDHYYSQIEFELIYLKDLFEGIMLNKALHDKISQCILPDGTISDHASETLFQIRKTMNSLQFRIRKKMESLVKDSKDVLSIDTFTTRNDRLVLPVKKGFKNQFGGLVHAQSSSGQTIYVEPEAVMMMNNEFNDLRIAENEEIQRILKQLSTMVKNFVIQFRFNQDILEELDFIFTKGQFGQLYKCCKPIIDENANELYLKEARHPLIDQQKVVPNTIHLDKQKMLLITGSNTGGKSVLLKTTGLLSLMALSGLLIPCVEATIPHFDYILVDLGDEQSIEQSLSTFSSHMKRIVNILNQVTSKSLVILDEVGSGTDPDEGESLAQAILEQLLIKDCYTLASTHYGHLKTFGKINDRILVGSVSFDVETLTPTYHLQLDRIGQSYALEIALNLGFEKQLIKRAKNIKEEKMTEAEILMEQLEKDKEALLQKEIKLNQLLLDNEKLQKKYDRKIEVLENSKDRIIDEAKNSANELLNETKQRIDEIVKEVRNPQIKDHQVINAKHLVDDMMYQKEEQIIKQDHILKVGDHVKVIKMNREGDIIEILNKNKIKVDLSGITVQLHEDEVIYMHPKTKIKPIKAAKRNVKMTKTASYELNVIGKRYEEAMAIVDKFLDDAIVAGYPHVRIVHGMGTGVLRKGIRKMLDKNKNVVSYRDGGPNEGGLGATLVYFEE